MTPRDTRTGGVLERMILPALKQGGYEAEMQVVVGTRLGGGRHRVDVVGTKNGEKILISLKWQQTGGTAEQKVPFEVMSLAHAVIAGEGDKAYLVLGGDGWTLKEFYLSGELSDHIVHADRVTVMNLESFVARANSGEL